MNCTLTAVEGIQVGHWTDSARATGCTVVLCPPEGCVASAVISGGGPSVRETALLEPEKSVQRIHAIALCGGSAFGLEAAGGVMRWLDERGIGFETLYGPIPIVPAAAIFDRWSGDPRARPGVEEGYMAAVAATNCPVVMGRIGAGTGARVGTARGIDQSAYGGLGSARQDVNGATVAALAVVNPGGNIVEPKTGQFLAGVPEGAGGFSTGFRATPGTNTTLVVVATDAPLSKAEAKLLAGSAQAGLARAITPVTLFDGDTCFVLSTVDGPEVPLIDLSVAIQDVVGSAIVASVKAPR
jgi:L-aminopeptidase/D-esterase-like protein